MLRKLLLALLALLSSAPALYAQHDDRVLLYYFRNLTGDRQYDDLMYSIPLCMYRALRERDAKVFIADRGEILDEEGNVRDLWAPAFIRSVGAKRGISTVVYGFFYLVGDRIVLRAQVFYLDSGLLLELTPESGALYEVLENIQGAAPYELRQCGTVDTGNRKSPRVLKVQQSTPAEIKQSALLHTLTWAAGPAFPVGEWSSVYPPGVAVLISYKVFPRNLASPLAFGFRTGAYAFSWKGDSSTVPSETFIFPMAATMDYVLLRSGSRGRVIGNLTLGSAMSVISIEADTRRSFDLLATGSLGFQFAFGDSSNLFARAGFGAVSFRGAPLYLLNVELGVRFFE